MPAIKKKWMKTNREDNAIGEDDPGKNESPEIENKEKEPVVSEDDVNKKKTVKRSLPLEPAMLKGLDGEVLLEKRKRYTPPVELKLSEWLDNNLEKRTEETIHLPLLYKYYTELCQADGSEILDVPEFNRMVKVKFGKAFGVQDSSIYKTLIKERKVGEKKKTGGGVKLKEILIEALNHFGNPLEGVRFFKLKSYVSTRYPALQIDSKPKILKRALEMGTNYGYIDLAKGIGMAGFYRLPGAAEPPPKPKVKSPKEGEVDGESNTDEEKKEGKEGESSADDATVETDEAKEEKEEESAKPKKAKKVQTWSYSKISYSNPSKIEDIFPLAITYQSAPKAVSVPRIRRYIQELYGEEVSDFRWRKALEGGVDKGFWEHISGSGITGRIHLLMDDFDPNSEQLEDRVCAAIIACHDPKTASANQIKKYISQYHTEFNVDQRPDRFKKALQKAQEIKMIRQLSGIGASGSFQLVVPFTPSPTVLAGDDDSEEESEYEVEKEDRQAYVPRGTKSRGQPKKETKQSQDPGKGRKSNSRTSNEKDKGSKATASKKSHSSRNSREKKTKGARQRSLSPLTDEEEEEEVEYTPQKSQSRGGASRQSNSGKGKSNNRASKGDPPKPKKTRERSLSPLTDEEEEDVPEYTPQKSQSRGGDKGEKREPPATSPKKSPKRSHNGSGSASRSSSKKKKSS